MNENENEYTVRTAYEQFFRGDTLSLRDAKFLLAYADVPKILSVMESAAERHKHEALRHPMSFIVSRLKKRPPEPPCTNTLHFDADGNKILTT